MDTNVSIWKFDIVVLINSNSVTAKETDSNGLIISTAMMLHKMATWSSSNLSHQVTYAKILLQFKAGFHFNNLKSFAEDFYVKYTVLESEWPDLFNIPSIMDVEKLFQRTGCFQIDNDFRRFLKP